MHPTDTHSNLFLQRISVEEKGLYINNMAQSWHLSLESEAPLHFQVFPGDGTIFDVLNQNWLMFETAKI